MTFQPRRLEDIPEEGRVMMGNPQQETAVAREAADMLTDYVLSPLVPEGAAYILNLDEILAQSSWSWESDSRPWGW